MVSGSEEESTVHSEKEEKISTDGEVLRGVVSQLTVWKDFMFNVRK